MDKKNLSSILLITVFTNGAFFSAREGERERERERERVWGWLDHRQTNYLAPVLGFGKCRKLKAPKSAK
jgi:hypothetical protein